MSSIFYAVYERNHFLMHDSDTHNTKVYVENATLYVVLAIHCLIVQTVFK